MGGVRESNAGGAFDRGRFVAAGAIDGATLMALDAALLAEADDGARPFRATLLVATWDPPAVSIGRFQRPEAAVDAARVKRAGFDVVRRPTGGRAVLHHGDVTYTLVARHDDPAFGGARAASLSAVADALVAGLAALGVAAGRAPGSRGEPHGGGARAAGGERAGRAVPPCFASAAREEIQAAGRKLLGSARLDGRRAFLQHGSLPLDARPLGLAALLPGDARARASAHAALAAATTSLAEILGRSVAPDEVAGALRLGFEARAGRPFAEERLPAGAWAAARRAAPRHRIAGGEALAPRDACSSLSGPRV
jgi:lipoate-protein ligase A